MQPNDFWTKASCHSFLIRTRIVFVLFGFSRSFHHQPHLLADGLQPSAEHVEELVFEENHIEESEHTISNGGILA